MEAKEERIAWKRGKAKEGVVEHCLKVGSVQKQSSKLAHYPLTRSGSMNSIQPFCTLRRKKISERKKPKVIIL